MRVLLSDGGGVTSRQTATPLHRAGHRVEVLAPAGFVLANWTGHVHAIHRAPRYGQDPWGWLSVARHVYREQGIEVLLPTQEQVAVLSRAAEDLAAEGVGPVVRAFAALAQVQDKIAAAATLANLNVPHPPTWVAHDQAQLLALEEFPVYVKEPIGTASSAVYRTDGRSELRSIAGRLAGALGRTGVVVQRAIAGELVMVTSVFDTGRLVAAHACRRTATGAQGGASHKESTAVAAFTDMLVRLGGGLRWHGALSLDIICGPKGPLVIDINPRLVEPFNAALAGLDLPGIMLALALGRSTSPLTGEHVGIRSHQLLQALLGTAASGAGRRGLFAELVQAALGRGAYLNSSEELTPLAGDPPAGVLVAGISALLLAAPSSWRTLSAGSVGGYALTPDSWQMLIEHSR